MPAMRMHALTTPSHPAASPPPPAHRPEADSGLSGDLGGAEGSPLGGSDLRGRGLADSSGAGGGGALGGPGAAAGWRGLSGSGLVAAALVSPPVCLHSTNARLGRVGPDFLYNLALAYK